MKEEDYKKMPEVDAEEVGLRYLSDDIDGYTRKKAGEEFVYLDWEGRVVRNASVLNRIEQLVIPPAWERVWISPYKNSHIQVTGYDKKGRKQYRYHPKWTKVRSQKKFLRMKEFGEVLPEIRNRVYKDLRRRSLSKEKVLATSVALLDQTLIRVGNDEYAKENDSYGLTTLRDKHVKNLGKEVHLEFKGKRKIEREVIVSDKKLASIIKKCKDIPGYELFQYYTKEGGKEKVQSEDINEYLREITGFDITAKYFRTWGGSCIAIQALMEFEETDSPKVIKKNLTQAVRKVSGCLGNTPTVCKNFYIHPIILDKYSEMELVQKIYEIERRGVPKYERLTWEEKVFMEVLKEYFED